VKSPWVSEIIGVAICLSIGGIVIWGEGGGAIDDGEVVALVALGAGHLLGFRDGRASR
jgi:hypothetical protein